jgi:sorbitol-specific phosphotransferase system component IIBC
MTTPRRILGFMAFIALLFGLINLLSDGNQAVTAWLYGLGASLLFIVLLWPVPKPPP